MLKKIKRWLVKKIFRIVLGMTANYFREFVRKQNIETQAFIDKLFNKDVVSFNEWGLEELYGDQLNDVTLINIIDKALDPVRDDIEDVIIVSLKEFNPRNG